MKSLARDGDNDIGGPAGDAADRSPGDAAGGKLGDVGGRLVLMTQTL
ncbi:hypothetical protein [Streptomyces sp. NPDC006195]